MTVLLMNNLDPITLVPKRDVNTMRTQSPCSPEVVNRLNRTQAWYQLEPF